MTTLLACPISESEWWQMLAQNPSPALEANHEEMRLWRWSTLVSLAITLVILVGLGAMLYIK